MNQKLREHLSSLKLEYLSQSWKEVIACANKQKKSYHKFLTEIIENEYVLRQEKQRLARMKAACIPEMFVMETFPFEKQPKLKKRMVMDIFDSMSYIEQSQWLYFVGPTGCGKSGLATSYLVNAIDNGYRGRFISFTVLMEQLYKSQADLSAEKTMKRFANIDCLVIDEFGYKPMNSEQAGLFFELIKMRHKKNCTLITTQHGFDEWKSFFPNVHTRKAAISRIIENCAVFAMQECTKIRPERIQYVTEK